MNVDRYLRLIAGALVVISVTLALWYYGIIHTGA